ncbi:MAG: LLM class F420-dependent oxidoreductase [Acidimicrobiia bacterium]|nr:LLM class F420-dependent oxidoreductase [Acidimicrobiia bacterium]RZV42570.1 MAG: LLM class F420-dependent oxidoreductase [Acidimicrobiales bacterium]
MKAAIAHFPTDYSIPPAELGPALESRGFESLWAAEHSHIPSSRKTPHPSGADLPKRYYDTYDPFVWLTALAGSTSTLKLATGICLIIQRDPIHTAKSVSSLDRLTGGRFMFGVGAGWNEDEMNNHGTQAEGRFKLMRERVQAMKEIWTNHEAEFHGDRVNFDPMMQYPKPLTKPHPPIHVGGAFPGGARRAVEWADGWIPIPGRAEGTIAEQIAAMRQQAADAGRDPASIEVSIYFAPNDVEKLQEFAEAGVDRVAFDLPSVAGAEALESLDASLQAFTDAGLTT